VSCFLKEPLSVRRFRPSCVAGDERGVATIEAIIVFVVLVGVFFTCLLLGRWGTGLQSAQMGARLLAFDAGDTALAKLGLSSRRPSQVFVTEDWDTLVDSLVSPAKAHWLDNTFSLANQLVTGSVTGTAQGRAPRQSGNLFSHPRTTLGYHARDWATSSNSWGMPESLVEDKFLLIWGNLVLSKTDTTGITAMEVTPIPQQLEIIETIFGRAGIR